MFWSKRKSFPRNIKKKWNASRNYLTNNPWNKKRHGATIQIFCFHQLQLQGHRLGQKTAKETRALPYACYAMQWAWMEKETHQPGFLRPYGYSARWVIGRTARKAQGFTTSYRHLLSEFSKIGMGGKGNRVFPPPWAHEEHSFLYCGWHTA